MAGAEETRVSTIQYSELSVIDKLSEVKKVKYPPIFACFGTIKLGNKENARKFVKRVTICILQFVIVMPLVAVLSVILKHNGVEDELH